MVCERKMIVELNILLLFSGCGGTSSTTDPSVGIYEPKSAVVQNNPVITATPSANVTVVQPATITARLLRSLPIAIGGVNLSTGSAVINGITEMSRDILYKSATTNWAVSASGTTMDQISSSSHVFFDILASDSSSSDNLTPVEVTPQQTAAGVWSLVPEGADGFRYWSISTTIKVPLKSPSGLETNCAILEDQRIIPLGESSAIDVNNFSIKISTGSCDSVANEFLTLQSAKTKISTGDSKQTVAVVMGNLGLQVMNSQLWCWVGSSVTTSCAKTSYSNFVSTPAVSCDCEIRFDSNGKVLSQKGVAGSVLDLPKW